MENSTRIGKNAKGYGYKYTDLAQIHEYLEERNMAYYQYIEKIENDDYIMTVPFIDGKELPARRGVKIVDAVLQGIKNPAQEQGSATTYARRYSLLMAFGLATEDDDGASLSQKVTKKTSVETKKENEIDYRQQLIEYATTQEIDLNEIAKQYKLNGSSTPEDFKEVLETLKGAE